MRSKTIIFLFFIIPALSVFGLPMDASPSEPTETEIIIIGNKKVPADTLTADEVKDIFLRLKTSWDDGKKITITLLEGGKTHEDFIRRYIQKTPAQYHRYWRKQVFAGRGAPPVTFRNEKSLMAHVALTQGAIGYISSKFKPTGVKVIKIVTKKEAVTMEKSKAEATPVQPENKESQSFLDGLLN